MLSNKWLSKYGLIETLTKCDGNRTGMCTTDGDNKCSRAKNSLTVKTGSNVKYLSRMAKYSLNVRTCSKILEESQNREEKNIQFLTLKAEPKMHHKMSA